MPETAEANAEKAAEDRHVTFHHHQLSLNGTTFVQAELDLADALDLDAAITAEAEALRTGRFSGLPRRTPRHRRRPPRPPAARPPAGNHRARGREPPRKGGRQVVLYVHLSEAAITGTTGGLELAQVNNHHRTVLADQVRTWCQTPEARVVVSRSSTSTNTSAWPATRYPPGLPSSPRSATGRARSPGAPAQPSAATSTTSSHTPAGGATCSCNTAPVCRRHHRLKTHTSWTYTVIDPGTYLWTSPHGYQFLRDRHGTTDVSRDRPPPRAPDPPRG